MKLSGKTKTILILTGTLVLGMVLGGLFTGYMIRKRVNELRALRMKGGIEAHIMKVLEPTEEQRKNIEPVIAEFAADMEEIHSRHIGEMRGRADAFREALSPLVSEEQMEKLDKSMKRMHGRHGRGPGHGKGRHHRGKSHH